MYFNLGNSYTGLGKEKESLERLPQGIYLFSIFSYKQCEKMNSHYPNIKEKIKKLEKK